MACLGDVVQFLDEELCIDDFQDSSNNGLQVGRDAEIETVCCGVDASMEFFRAARKRKADLLVCHHGLSWGDSLKYITGLNYSRLAYLMRTRMALYACHLPLDAHARYGNNIQLCKALGLQSIRPFATYHGRQIGFRGILSKPVRFAALKARIARITGSELQCMEFGRSTVQSVAVVSGGAAEQVAEAGSLHIDVYLSGEPGLVAYSLAQEHGIHAVFAGHYATEVFGVRALAGLLHRRFGLQAEFIDLEVPF